MSGELENRVAGLERALRTMDERQVRHARDLAQAVKLIQAAAVSRSGQSGEEDLSSRLPGHYWHCVQCNVRLGFQREDTDELRLKYKEFIVTIFPGPASVVEIPCVKCGHRNRIEDTRKS